MKSVSYRKKPIALTGILLILISNLAVAQDVSLQRDQLEVSAGTKIPLILMNFINSRNARIGDKLYLQTAYPITVSNRIVIPPGTHVRGSIIDLKRPGRVRGKGEMLIRFEEMILPNGVTRLLTGRLSSLDGRLDETLDKEEGKIVGGGAAGRDAAAVGAASGAGTAIGAAAGKRSDRTGSGAAIGAGAGALVALAAVLLTRGPDTYLARGTMMDMMLLEPLRFATDEVKFSDAQLSHNPLKEIPEPVPAPIILRRYPYPYPYTPPIVSH